MLNLDGKVAVISGAGSGIGKSQAELLLDHGAKVTLVDINEEAMNEFVNQSDYTDEEILVLKTDITQKREVEDMVEKVIEKFGKIDFLLNTAGAFDEMAPIMDTSEELWTNVMEVNINGLYLVTKAVLPHMLENEEGRIINIASDAGLTGGGGGISYTSSKHAVVGFTRQIAADYKNEGIKANTIAPGLIETPMTEELMENEEFRNQVLQASGRLGQPEDIAKATLFLVSDLADYINAIEIPVDGGLLNSL